MCLAQGPQGIDACEARTRGPSVSSEARSEEEIAEFELYCQVIVENLGPSSRPLMWYCIKLQILF